MKNKNKISVTIITGNEEVNIRECLESVKWADEIIVVDSESSDKTVEIAKSFTEKVFIRKWEGYASQKNFAMERAANIWVLSIDADEKATKELSEEILTLKFADYDGFKIKRENFFIGKQITGCGWGNDYQVRLFNKNKTKLTDRLVHEGFVVNGKLGTLKNSMIHYSYRNLKDGFSKINEYSSLEANEKAKRKRITGLRLVFFPVWAFIQHFFIRKGFKDGRHGLIVSLMHAMTKLQVYMKIWEIKR
jgi:glycosyltransferase involved in cell wall biosynthesis